MMKLIISLNYSTLIKVSKYLELALREARFGNLMRGCHVHCHKEKQESLVFSYFDRTRMEFLRMYKEPIRNFVLKENLNRL